MEIFGTYEGKISENEARKRLSFPVDQPVILFFGMIKPSKGLDVFGSIAID